MIVFFVSDYVEKCRDFSFLLQGKLLNIEWQHGCELASWLRWCYNIKS